MVDNKPETQIAPYLKNIQRDLGNIERNAIWMENRHMNSPVIWSRNWSEYLKDGEDSLQEMCENLTYFELIELVAFELIEKIIETKKAGLLSHGELPYLYNDLIRGHYDNAIKKGKGGLFTKLGKLTWNTIEKAIRTKEAENKAYIEERRKEIAERK